MKNTLFRHLFVLLFLALLASCGKDEKKTDPTPPTFRHVELQARYSGMTALGGSYSVYQFIGGTRNPFKAVDLPNGGPFQDVGTDVSNLGTFDVGSRVVLRVELRNVTSEATAAGLNPRSTTPRPPSVMPVFLDVDLLLDGQVVKTVSLDKDTPMNWAGQRNLFTEFTQEIK